MIPICGKCGVEMRPVQIGQPVECVTPPRFLARGDRYGCEVCGAQVVVNLSDRRFSHAADYGVIRGIYLSEGLIRIYKTAAERDADREQRREQ